MNAQFDRVLEGLYEKLPQVAEHLELTRDDIFAFTAFPKEIWSNPTSVSTGDPPPH